MPHLGLLTWPAHHHGQYCALAAAALSNETHGRVSTSPRLSVSAPAAVDSPCSHRRPARRPRHAHSGATDAVRTLSWRSAARLSIRRQASRRRRLGAGEHTGSHTRQRADHSLCTLCRALQATCEVVTPVCTLVPVLISRPSHWQRATGCAVGHSWPQLATVGYGWLRLGARRRARKGQN